MLINSPGSATTFDIPAGVEVIPDSLLDLRPDDEIVKTILSERPITSEKNIWAFWDRGWSSVRPWSQRNVICWARRLEPLGWTIRVLDTVPGSPFHISRFLDMGIFPEALRTETMDGPYAPQHVSDLVRIPLVYTHGGCWVDVGAMIFGDLEYIWQAIINPSTSYKLSAIAVPGRPDEYSTIANTFLVARKGDEFLKRWHQVFVALWKDRTNATGVHNDLLISWLGPFPLDGLGPDEDGFKGEATLTDYLAQMMCFERLALLEDPGDGFSGRKYIEEHMFVVDGLEMSYAHDSVEHDGQRLFDLLASSRGHSPSDRGTFAEKLISHVVAETFLLKIYHGPCMTNPALGYIWDRPENADADVIPGSYSTFLRFAMVYLKQLRTLRPAPVDKIPDDYVLMAGVCERKDKQLVRRKLK